MPAAPQTYENHKRLIPAFHVFAFGVLAVNALWALYNAFTAPALATIFSLLLAVAFIVLFFYMRIFALTVQDRLIRLEMRLLLAQVLPADLRERVGELSAGQLIGLRFASDAELPDLVRRVLDEKIFERDRIKRMIREWKPDLLRV